MSGFKSEPTRGDGFSSRRSKEIFKKASWFKQDSPEEVARQLKEIDHRNFDKQDFKIPTVEELLEPNTSMKRGSLIEKYRGGDVIAFMNGFWATTLQLVMDGKPMKYPMWTLGVLVGSAYKVRAHDIRTRVIEKHGEPVYEQWKALVKDDTNSLYSSLASACDYLGNKNSVGLSYVTSPSSARLLDTCNLRVERDHVFLFPHYKTHLEEMID